MRRVRHWFRDLFGRRRVERDLDAEIRHHIEFETQSLIDAGLSRAEASRRARAEFGAVEAIKDECRDARDTHGFDSLARDATHGLRMMRRYPLFTATAVATLALTIGAVSTLLSLAHTFMLRPLPVPAAERMVYVQPTQDQGANDGPISFPDYQHFRRTSNSFEELAAIYPTAPLFVTREGEGRQVNGAVVSQNFLRMMRLEPHLGRFFAPGEDEVPGRDRVVVIGYAFWQVWFGGLDEAVGAQLRVNGVDFTIIGVLPPRFTGVDSEALNVLMPTMMMPVGYRWCDDALADDCTILRMYGRLADNVEIPGATAEMTTVLPQDWRDAEPGEDSGIRITAVRGAYMSGVDREFLALLGIVVTVLMVACCANLAGLLISRGRARAHELAVRVSLGAGYGRLVRQLTIESLMLAGVGGALGLLISIGMTGTLTRIFYTLDSSGRPLTYNFELAPQVVAGVLVATLLAGLLFGVVPALVTARRGTRAALGSTRGGTATDRWQGLLIGGQAALAVAMVAIAGLLAAGAQALAAGRGFDPEQVALMRLRPRLIGYSAERAQPYLRQVVGRLESLPEVESVTMVGTGIALMGFRTEVETVGGEPRALLTGYMEIGPAYFETLGMEVVRGREFEPTDDMGSAAVAVVSEQAAATLWPGLDPLGQVLRVGDREHQVVGVVAEISIRERTAEGMPYVYLPFWQNPQHIDARLQIRVAGDPAAALPVLTAAVHAVDPDVPIAETITLSWRVAGMFRPQRLSATAVVYAAALAVFLSGIGLYSSLAASVVRRRREFGVRQAVGASAGGVLAMVLRQGMTVIGGGAAVGILLSAAATRSLAHMLYTPPTSDYGFFAAAFVLVLACGLGSTWLPARRASRVAPSVALRDE